MFTVPASTSNSNLDNLILYVPPFSPITWLLFSCSVWLFATPQTLTRQALLSFTISWILLKLTSIELVMPSSHLVFGHPLLFLPSILLSIRSFLMSWLSASGGQSTGGSTSASVLPMNIQDWFPLEFTDLISLQSKGFSRVFSNTTVQKHQFFSAHYLIILKQIVNLLVFLYESLEEKIFFKASISSITTKNMNDSIMFIFFSF